MEQIIRKKMLFEQKKKKRILKFNPGLALISFRTSGTPSLMTELVMHMRPVERGPDFQGEPVSMNVTIISTQKYLTSSDYRPARSARSAFFFRARQFFSTLSLVPGYTTTSLWVVFTLLTLYFKTVDWSLTTRIKQWEKKVVLSWAGSNGEGRKYQLP